LCKENRCKLLYITSQSSFFRAMLCAQSAVMLWQVVRLSVTLV